MLDEQVAFLNENETEENPFILDEEMIDAVPPETNSNEEVKGDRDKDID